MYDPSHDTFLLLDEVRRRPPGRFLELGTGTGLVAIAAALAGHRVVATDVNPIARRLARENARLNGASVDVVGADLLAGLRAQRFDLVAMNPPYLPTAANDRVPGPLHQAFDGGPTGRRVVERLWTQCADLDVPLLVVASSLQRLDALESAANAHGLALRLVAETALPHERLQLLEARPRTRKGY